MTSSTRRSRDPIANTLLWLILLLAAGLRFFRIGSQSFWADEGNSIALAGRSFAEITAAAAADIHPPLYYWLLKIWTTIFGNSEVAARSLSALAGIGLVWLVYLFGSRLHNQRAGLIAAFFAAINPFLIYYSQEARMYSLLAMLAALLFYALIRFILHESVVLPADGSGQTISFAAAATVLIVLSSVAGMYTHYTFPVVLGTATLLYFLWIFDSRRRGFVWLRVVHWALLLGVVVFFFLPWIGHALRQLGNWPRSGESVPLSRALGEVIRLLALGPVTQIPVNSPWMAIFGILFALGLWPWARPGQRRAHWLTWGLPLLWLAAPAALMLVTGLYTKAFLKFLVVAVPPFCLLMAQGVTGFADALARGRSPRPARIGPAQANKATSRPVSGQRRPAGQSKAKGQKAAQPAAREPAQAVARGGPISRWLAWGWTALALVLVSIPSTLTLQAYYFDPAAARDDYRDMAAYIEAAAHPDDAIILNAPGQQDVFSYYYRGDLPVYGLPEQRPPDEKATIARLEQIASQHRHLYALFWATDESDPQRSVEGWLDTHAYKAVDKWQGNVRFVFYATQPPAADWPVQSSGAVLGNQIELLNYALALPNVNPGDVVAVQLNWQALEQPQADYTVFVQLLDSRNQIIAQRDSPPVSGGRPTGGWQPGEQIVDNHGILVLPATAPGDYRLIAGLYNAETGQRLATPYADYVDLGAIRIDRPDQPPEPEALNMMHEDRFTFQEVTLLGHDRYKRGFRHTPETPLRPNDLLHLTFYWRADVGPTAAWRFTARLVQGAGKEVAAVSGPLVSDLYPTLNWQAGEIVRGEHDMLLPDYLEPGTYQLQLFLHTGSSPEEVADRVNLGRVTIER